MAGSPTEKEQLYCQHCKKVMMAREFYRSNNKEKYPNGYLRECRKCITRGVNNWEPETYLWLLQEIDVPYIQNEWYTLLERYGRNEDINGMTILGRYIGKMHLDQYRKYRWADSQYLADLAANKARESMEASGYTASEVDKALRENFVAIPEKPVEPERSVAVPEVVETVVLSESAPPDYFEAQLGFSESDLVGDLTEEDKKYLFLKWGKSYKPEEWVRLENLYTEMSNSYDIVGAGHEDTLKFVCKTSLKANQLLDIGD